MIVLGLWDGHDSGAAVFVRGRLAAAINEERLSRRKLEVRFPSAAITECLELASVRPADVDIVATCSSDPAKAIARLFPSTKESYYAIRRRVCAPGLTARWTKSAKYWLTELRPDPLSRWVSRRCLRRDIDRLGLTRAALCVHDHHRAHAAAAFHASGFGRAVVVTIDGVGDGYSSTVSVGNNGALTMLDSTPASDSPGIFFEHVTNLLNMRELEDEGKVMALAGYASPPTENPLTTLLWAEGMRFRTAVAGHALRARLSRVQWRFPNEQFARMAQEALEVACVQVVQAAVRATGIDRVALAGGVASNIQVNRSIRLLAEVSDVFVFPHMGDGGLAVGAALLSIDGSRATPLFDSPSLALGRGYDDAAIRQSLDRSGLTFQSPADPLDAVARLLVNERVVLWFQGRGEYGPRALGHRSILARPDRPAVRDRLNRVLKRRVWYQPFCPSMLESDARCLLADWKGTPDRLMTMGYQTRVDRRDSLAAVVNIDGTCRPQIVRDDATDPFAELLQRVKQHIGVGAVLNTSFNMHGEPVVSTPDEAIDVFRRSGADALLIGSFLLLQPEGE